MHSEKERDMKREDKIGETGREGEKQERDKQSEREIIRQRKREKGKPF